MSIMLSEPIFGRWSAAARDGKHLQLVQSSQARLEDESLKSQGSKANVRKCACL